MRRSPIGLLLFGLILSACAPAPQAVAPAQGGSVEVPARPAARKIVTVAHQYEPVGITETFIVSQRSTTSNDIKDMVHDNLMKSVESLEYAPLLATELPSLDRNTWRVNPDGTMETTWRLRPNIKWHDGRPFTSADLVFTFATARDTEIAGQPVLASDRLIEGVSAPDDLTLVMHWSAPYVEAHRIGVGQIVPRHLLEEAYKADKRSLTTTTTTSTDFVGLGPYRLATWERGSHVELTRFDDYYLGRPPLDTIVVRFIADANTMVANILAGAVDVIISTGATGVSLDQVMEVKRRWEGTGNQVIISRSGLALWAEAQFRPDYGKPVGAMDNLNVRKALLQAIDRQTLADVMTFGFSPVADSYFMPDEPRRPEMEASIAKFPYDPARAQQLLTEAGWQRGADGVLVRQSDGVRFELDFWARAGATERTAAVITDDWKRLGVAATPVIIPQPLQTRENEGKRPGFLCCVRVGVANFYGGKLHQRQIGTEATRWNGLNYGGYVNLRADALVDQLETVLDPRARLPLERELVQEYSANVAMIPLWWQIYPQLALAGVKGLQARSVSPATYVFDWDKSP